MTKEEGLEQVRGLIQQFTDRGQEVVHTDYLEAQVRTQFLDRFFGALGWDVSNHKEATVEKSQAREDGSKKRADYAFHVSGKEFFVEAKKPSENLDANKDHAIQARMYAYSANHPAVILTDFEEFYVYKGRGVVPKDADDAKVAIISELSCKSYLDYPAKWDAIWDAFSRESVLAGSLEKIPGVVTDKKGAMPVDQLFLADIEKWRKSLAENIHTNNPNLPRRTLNEAVQKTIDRIVFLRICEDRDIEEYGQILKAGKSDSVYKALCNLFRQADTRYNSGLFHFKKETGREEFDNHSLNLTIDNEPLQKIIDRLYWPGGPYAFAVMPADILGQVYERFLGKVIEIDGDSVTVEDKPEVKKAGGVFYTPEYIVDYIVKNTVGRLVEGKKPETVAKLRIVDPACGSGAFLINAYQYLLDWHLACYTANKPDK
ncbi:MAG: N-6 DNA methylase [Proteobacteria bacterium]|nr:N-6 DNA methylase [Pseudomonadota bacterium]